MNGPKVQFIVPTLKRVEFLKLCLDSINGQTVPPVKIFVGVRADDYESAALLGSYRGMIPVERVVAGGVGVVGSMNSCLEAAQKEVGDYIALVDDDVELPSDWLKTMLAHLAANPAAIGSMGRDLLQDHPEMRRTEPLVHDVGRVHWYGRITGNHHRGGGGARIVQVFRGSNVLFRGDFLTQAGFETELRGQGAQVHWELALAFQAASLGQSLFYDPGIQVLHHTAPRHDQDSVHRGIFNFRGVLDMCYNETYVVLKHAPWNMKWAILAWQLLVGSRSTPGLANLLRRLVARDANIWLSVQATMQGRIDAWRSRGLRRNANERVVS